MDNETILNFINTTSFLIKTYEGVDAEGYSRNCFIKGTFSVAENGTVSLNLSGEFLGSPVDPTSIDIGSFGGNQ